MNLFAEWTTPLVADACLRLQVPVRVATPGIAPLAAGMRAAGRARPVRHWGSVDVFLESMLGATPGEVLVIDNGGRTDEGCIGDLTVLEVEASGLVGVVLWGLHRDTAELRTIGLPVFSYGRCPMGPTRLDARAADSFTVANFGAHRVTADDVVFADEDGVIFVPLACGGEVARKAEEIWQVERKQAGDVANGRLLREQLRLADFIAARREQPALTFREHLRAIRGAIEE
ncbi:MAG: dimethylmenaquinone methyltransferase [Opitutus sp.]|nr:dimethylmenaquinone methyltransferase [Opitutus sp.]